jgi:hypothetical protein
MSELGRLSIVFLLLLWAITPGCSREERGGEAVTAEEPSARQVSDVLFVWANPNPSAAYELSASGTIETRDPAQYAQANAASRAAILGLNNVVMAGSGLPEDGQLAEKWTQEVAHLGRVVWELMPDDVAAGESYTKERGFSYSKKVELLHRLKEDHPQIEAVLLDDMSTVAVDKGFRPEHIAKLRQELDLSMEVWGVVYELSLDKDHLPDYVKELDVINFWTWHAEEVRQLEENIARVERMASGKPIVLGLYMYDYGENRKMPPELMKLQCQTALSLVQSGRVRELVFLSVNNDPEIIQWTHDWIAEVASKPLP